MPCFRVPERYWSTGKFFHELEDRYIELWYYDLLPEELADIAQTFGLPRRYFFWKVFGVEVGEIPKPWEQLSARAKGVIRRVYRQGYFLGTESPVYCVEW